jgi:hypothetical protein
MADEVVRIHLDPKQYLDALKKVKKGTSDFARALAAVQRQIDALQSGSKKHVKQLLEEAEATERLTKAVNGHRRAMKRLGEENASTDRVLQGLVDTAKKAAAAYAAWAAAAAAVRKSVDLETALVKINTLVGVNQSQVDAWAAQLGGLAEEVGSTQTELAKALFVVTSAGAEASEALNIVEAAGKASAVGLGEVETIARAVTAAVAAYKDENYTAAQAVDTLVATVRFGNLEAAGLADTLGRIIGISQELGVSLEEAGAFIATFTRLGVAPEEAVTALRGFFSALMGGAAQSELALDEVGLSMAELRQQVDEAGLAPTLVKLVNSFQAIGKEDLLKDAVPNVRALAGVLGTASAQADTFLDIEQQIIGSAGILDEAFATTSQRGGLALDQIVAGLERIQLAVGDELLEAVAAAAREFGGYDAIGESLAKVARAVGALAVPAAKILGVLADNMEVVLVLLAGAKMSKAIGSTFVLKDSIGGLGESAAGLAKSFNPLTLGLTALVAAAVAGNEAIKAWSDRMQASIDAMVAEGQGLLQITEQMTAAVQSMDQQRQSALRADFQAQLKEEEAALGGLTDQVGDYVQELQLLEFWQKQMPELWDKEAKARQAVVRELLAEAQAERGATSGRLERLRKAIAGLDDALAKAGKRKELAEVFERTEAAAKATAFTLERRLSVALRELSAESREAGDDAAVLTRALRDLADSGSTPGELAVRELDAAMIGLRERLPEVRAQLEAATQAIEAKAAADIAAAESQDQVLRAQAEREDALADIAQQLKEVEAQERALTDAETNRIAIVENLTAADREAAVAAEERAAAAEAQGAWAEAEIGFVDALTAATLEGARAVEELRIAEQQAAVISEIYNATLEATAGDQEAAADAAARMEAALKKLNAAQEAAEEGENTFNKWERIIDGVRTAVGGLDEDMGRLVGSISDAAQAWVDFARAKAAGDKEGMAAARGRGSQAAAGVVVGAAGMLGGGGTSRFGGAMTRSMTKEGAQLGATFGVWGAVIGAVVGSFIKKQGDQAEIVLTTAAGASGGTIAAINKAEGGLKEISQKITQAFNELLESLETTFQAEFVEPVGGLSLSIEDNIITVAIGNFTKRFTTLDAALAFAGQQIVAANSDLEVLGENTRQLFENMRAVIGGGLGTFADFQQIVQTTAMADAIRSGTIARTEYVELLRQEDKWLTTNLGLAQRWGVALEAVFEVSEFRLEQIAREVDLNRRLALGARDSFSALGDFAQQMLDINLGLESSAAARRKLAAVAERRAAALFDIWQRALQALEAGLDDAAEVASQAGGKIAAGMIGGIAGMKGFEDGLRDLAGRLHSTTGGMGTDAATLAERAERARQEWEDAVAGIGQIPEGFDPEDIAEVWTAAAANAFVTLLDLIQQIRGEGFMAGEERAQQAALYMIQLGQQIDLTQQLLDTVDTFSEASRAALVGAIDAANQLIADLASGAVTIPEARPAAAGRGGGRRQAREDFRAELAALEAALAGTTPEVAAFTSGLDAIAAAAAEASKIGLAADELTRFVQAALEVQEQDFLAPFRSRIKEEDETDLETELRLLEEARAAELAKAEALARAQAEAGLGTFEDLFAEFSAVINQAFDLDVAAAATAAAEAHNQALEDEARAREDALEKLDSSIDQWRQMGSGVRGAAADFGRLETDMERLRGEARELITDTGDLARKLEELDAVERDAAAGISRNLIQELTGMGVEIEGAAEMMIEYQRTQALASLAVASTNEVFLGMLNEMGTSVEEIAEQIEKTFDRQLKENERTADKMQGQIRATFNIWQQAADRYREITDLIADTVAEWTAGTMDPVQRELAAVVDTVAELSEEFLAAGGAVAGLVELEAAAAEQRRRILEEAFEPLAARFRELEITTAGENIFQQFERMKAETEALAAAVAGGEFGKVGDLVSASEALEELIRTGFGATTGLGRAELAALQALLASVRPDLVGAVGGGGGGDVGGGGGGGGGDGQWPPGDDGTGGAAGNEALVMKIDELIAVQQAAHDAASARGHQLQVTGTTMAAKLAEANTHLHAVKLATGTLPPLAAASRDHLAVLRAQGNAEAARSAEQLVALRTIALLQ